MNILGVRRVFFGMAILGLRFLVLPRACSIVKKTLLHVNNITSLNVISFPNHLLPFAQFYLLGSELGFSQRNAPRLRFVFLSRSDFHIMSANGARSWKYPF